MQRVVDPSRGIDEVGEICVKDGVFCGSVSGAAEGNRRKGAGARAGICRYACAYARAGADVEGVDSNGDCGSRGGWIHFRDGDAQYVPRGGFSVNNPPYKRYYF